MRDEPLPGMPEVAEPQVKAPAGQRMSRYTGRRRLCDRCVQTIHAVGVSVAPYPMPAKWRLTCPDQDVYLCYRCKEDYP